MDVLVLSGRPDHARVWEAVWVNPPVTGNANWRRHPAAVTRDSGPFEHEVTPAGQPVLYYFWPPWSALTGFVVDADLCMDVGA